jgi:hypothetical protein
MGKSVRGLYHLERISDSIANFSRYMSKVGSGSGAPDSFPMEPWNRHVVHHPKTFRPRPNRRLSLFWSNCPAPLLTLLAHASTKVHDTKNSHSGTEEV